MKFLISLSILASFVLNAGEIPLYRESFEKQLPGQTVNQWYMLFGSKNGMTMRISNVRSTDGENSVEFCNTGKRKYYSFAIPFQGPFRGMLRISFHIFCSGTGSFLNFELREKKSISRPFFYGSAGQELSISSVLEKTADPKAKKRASCGKMKRDIWYRVYLQIPLNAAAGKMAFLSLKELPSGNEIRDQFAVRYPETALYWLFGGGDGKAEYRVWLDEMNVFWEDF